jgi:hypothetical protein
LCTTAASILDVGDPATDLANEKYAQLLSSELFPSQSDHDPFASSSSTTPPVTPSKPRTTRLFSTPTRTPPINGNLFGLSSPSHPSYATSPLKPQSLRALSFPPSTPRSFPKVPYKVLDAPDLQDDFYLNLVDWSKDCNMLGVALHSAVYTWNAETSHVDKLCDISVEHDVVTSISWVHNVSECLVYEFLHLIIRTLVAGCTSSHWNQERSCSNMGCKRTSQSPYYERSCVESPCRLSRVVIWIRRLYINASKWFERSRNPDSGRPQFEALGK